MIRQGIIIISKKGIFTVWYRLFLSVVLLVTMLLVACSGGEARQEEYYSRAQQYFEEAQFDKALIEVKNVLQINANHVSGRFLLARLFEQDKDWERMYANLGMVVDLDPNHVPARLKLAQMLLANQLYDKASEQLDAVDALEPDNLDAWAQRAALHYRNGDYEDAISLAQKALSKDSGHVAAITVLSMVYSEDNPELALALISDGIKQQTGDASLKLIKIGLLEKQQQTEEIIKTYRELVEGFPDNLFYHYLFVRYLEKSDRIDEAEIVLRDIVNTKPKNAELKLWLTQFMASNRDPELAEATLKAFIEQNPNLLELRFGLGRLYTILERYDEAWKVYAKLISLDNEGADGLLARTYQVELLLRKGDRFLGEKLLAEVFRVERENEEALIIRGRLSLKDVDTKSAIADLRVVLRNNPGSVEALKILAQAHELDGIYNLALDNYRQVLQIRPTDDDALYHAARLAFDQGEYDSAEELLLTLARKHPDNAEVVRKLVSTYGKQGQWSKALLKADGLIAREETASMGSYLKGRIFFDQENYPAAILAFEQALSLESAAIEPLRFLVQARKRSGELDQAYEYLIRHIEAYPEQAYALELAGNVQQQRGEFAEAQGFYQRAINVAPKRSSVYRYFASLKVAQGDIEGADTIYKLGITNNPEDTELLMSIAVFNTRNGDFKSAVINYERILEINSRHGFAANNLAAALIDYFPTEENLKRAITLSEPLVAKNRNPLFLDTLGWAYYKLGNRSQALNLLNEAVQSGGKSGVYHYHLGMAYHSSNQHSLARKHLELALQNDKEDYLGKEEAELTLTSML